MNDEQNMINYQDNDENEIKVTAGYRNQPGSAYNDKGELKNKRFQRYSTKVYENDDLMETFSEIDVGEDLYIPIQAKLEDLAKAGAEVDEVISAIHTIADMYAEDTLRKSNVDYLPTASMRQQRKLTDTEVLVY